jgi:hypothetical protein
MRSDCLLTPYVVNSLILCPVLEVFPAPHRNYCLLVEKASSSVCLHFIFLLTMAVILPHNHLFVILLQFHFLFNTLGHHFSVWSNSPKQFIVLLLKSSHYPGDELSMYNLCPIFSVLYSKSGYGCVTSCHQGNCTFPLFA